MPFASPGYFGFVEVPGMPAISATPEKFIRAATVDLKATQTIDKPPLIDGEFNLTTYQLGAIEVGGGVTFPALHQSGGGSTAALYLMAMARSEFAGRLIHTSDFKVKYGGSIATNAGGVTTTTTFRYTDCQVNTWEMSVAQSDVINMTLDVVGKRREKIGQFSKTAYPNQNARFATWNDFRLSFDHPTLGLLAGGDAIRNFTLTINNNVTRFYTLNEELFVEDITALKREMTGNVTALGRLGFIGDRAFSNQNRCFENSSVTYGFETPETTGTEACGSTFLQTLNGVAFEIEEMSLSPDIFETTVNFHALGQQSGTVGDGADAKTFDDSVVDS
tara:strand:- start:643 stop:1641 length:999 start_codon:yes stop_codon:yes gene_type:complete